MTSSEEYETSTIETSATETGMDRKSTKISTFTFRDVAAISAGGFVGANARYILGTWATTVLGSQWPFGTWLINITGCFVLGLFVPMQQARGWSDQMRLAVAIGFLGAYTTYSTFELDTYGLIEQHRYGAAVGYAASSFAVGFLAVYLGSVTARLLNR